jgi:outer membrane protein
MSLTFFKKSSAGNHETDRGTSKITTMQKLRGLLTTTLILAVFAMNAHAQKSWSLQDCIDYAIDNNINIKQQYLNEESTRYDLDQSYANLFPNLNAEGQHGYSFGRSVDPFTNEFSTERIMRQNAGLSSSVVLFAGFQNMNYLRRNMLRNTAVRFDTERLQNDITLSIAAAYMQILYNEDYVETALQQVDLIEQQLERTRILFEGGTLPRGSVLEIEARLAEEELNLITSRNYLRLSYLELIQLLDLDPTEEFLIQRPEIDIADQTGMDNPNLLFEKALQTEPGIKAANARVYVAEKQLALERGRMSPSLSLIGSMGTGYSEAAQRLNGEGDLMEPIPYKDQIRNNLSQFVGLNLRVPIFNRWDVRTRVQQSRIEFEKAQNNYDISRLDLNKTIHQAHADAIAALQKYQATVKSLDAFEESFSYTRQRFELGMVSSVEFNESQTRLARAEREALQAKYDFVFKKKIMEFYTGEGFRL